MTTKGEIINGAYSRLRISGLTAQPSPEDVSLALDQLEDTVRELESRNICLGYNFTEFPDPADEATIPSFAVGPLKDVLADRMAPYFGKIFDARVAIRAVGILTSATAVTNKVEYPDRMPIGSGNRRLDRYRRYYQPQGQPPISCSTENSTRESTLDFTYDITKFLTLPDGTIETVDTYTLEPDTSNLTVVSSSFTDTVLSYRITVSESAREYEFLNLKVTTDGGRIQNFRLDFSISDSKVAVQ